MSGNQKPRIIKFNQIEHKLLTALKTKTEELQINEPVNLFEGFVNQPFGAELGDSFVIGGPTVPMIMLIGAKSGRIYFFALKAILPDIGL